MRRRASSLSDYCRLCREARRDGRLAIPRGWKSSIARLEPLDFGRMDRVCPKCGALFWEAELVYAGSQPTWQRCCKLGDIPAHNIPKPPPLLAHWLSSNTDQSKLFRKWIRVLNSALAYTSIGGQPDPRLRSYEHLYIFQLLGSIYHMIGPMDSSAPSYAQLYFLDAVTANALRLESQPLLKACPTILAKLDALLRDVNPYYHWFCRAQEILLKQDTSDPFSDIRLTPQVYIIAIFISTIVLIYVLSYI